MADSQFLDLEHSFLADALAADLWFVAGVCRLAFHGNHASFPPLPLEIVMQTPLKLVLALLLTSAAVLANATDTHHPDDAQTPSAQVGEQTTPATDKAVAEQMQKMRAAQDKVAAAKTPTERQAAMQESMQTMKGSMAMMRDMHSGDHCKGMSMSKSENGGGMGMMDMMMQMMDQQSSMMNMQMSK
jgi:hypothetical protein